MMLGLRGRTKRRSRSIPLLLATVLGASASLFVFTGVSGAQTSVIVSAADTVTAGDSIEVCFDIVDDDGDPESIAASVATFSVSPAGTADDTEVPAAVAAYTSGDECGYFEFETAGVKVVTVSIAGSDSSDDDNTNLPVKSGSTEILVIPDDAEVLECTVPATATAGVPFQFTITAYDDYGNATEDVDADLDLTFWVTPEDAANVLPGTTEWPNDGAGNATSSSLTLNATLWTSGSIFFETDGDEGLQDDDPFVCNGILVTAPAPTPSGGTAAGGASGSTSTPKFTG